MQYIFDWNKSLYLFLNYRQCFSTNVKDNILNLRHPREFLRGDITASEDEDQPLSVAPHYFIADEGSQGSRP